MSRSKAKHSNVLSLSLAALLPFAALAAGCGSGDGGPTDVGSGPASDPHGAGSSTGTGGSSDTAMGGAGGSATMPTSTGGAGSSEGGTPGTGGAPSSAGTGGTAGTITPPATGGSTGAGGTPSTGGTTATGGTPAMGGATGAGSATGAGGSAGAGGTPATGGASGTGGAPVTTSTGGGPIKYVFAVVMENESSSSVYGSSDAPYLNGLIKKYAHATAFADPLPDALPSEPHYVWMEAGTNSFSDTTFTTDSDPSASNSTKSTAHLVTQMEAASPAVSWMSYPEGLSSSTGACPVHSSGFYAAKHDPFVFFQDTAGSPPSATNATCAAHHQAYTTASFAQALAQGTVAQYSFVVPNLCNDMHGASGCPSSNVVAAGDAWLQANLPPMIDFVNAHQGVLFIMWDEPEGGTVMPFVAIGPGVKIGYTGGVAYTHGSFTKSVDEIFGLPVLSTVTGANDLADLFQPGMFP
ncbi:MAG TPA: alkaline phosphatase family protein [Polyangia bacterium]|nr:alkaline phosphatase family protein [Polyangia bacterium]